MPRSWTIALNGAAADRVRAVWVRVEHRIYAHEAGVADVGELAGCPPAPCPRGDEHTDEAVAVRVTDTDLAALAVLEYRLTAEQAAGQRSIVDDDAGGTRRSTHRVLRIPCAQLDAGSHAIIVEVPAHHPLGAVVDARRYALRVARVSVGRCPSRRRTSESPTRRRRSCRLPDPQWYRPPSSSRRHHRRRPSCRAPCRRRRDNPS